MDTIEVKTPEEPQEDLPPDGGREAWMTLAGGWLFYFCGLGYVAATFVDIESQLHPLLQLL